MQVKQKELKNTEFGNGLLSMLNSFCFIQLY